MMKDPNLPKLEDEGDFFPVQLDAAGRFVGQGQALRAPLRRADDDLAVPQGPVREVRRPHEAGPRLRPTPSDDSTWEQFYKTSKWFKENAEDDVPYGHGQQAKQHDSLMNDFSNVLWAYGGDYFKDGGNVGGWARATPASRSSTPTRRSRPPTSTTARLDRAPRQPGLGLGRARLRVRRRADGDGGQLARVRGRQRDRQAQGQDRLRAAAEGPQALRLHVRRHRRRHQRDRLEKEQKAAWLFVNWATSKKTQLANLESKVGGGTPTRESVYKLPEVEKAKKPPSKMPNILTADAVFEAWKPENIGLRPKIAAWNECDTAIFTAALEDARRPAGPGEVHANTKDGFVQAIDNADSLRNA
jgi:multiple sugar transport system substrate-binding protein